MPRNATRAGTGDPTVPVAPARARRRSLLRGSATALFTAAAVAACGGGEAYWLCVPAVLLAAAGCRTRLGTGMAAAVVSAAAMAAALARAGGAAHLPPAPLAVLVPAASAAILLALRERLEREREAMRVSALTDGLTGVANRRSVLARTEYEILRHQRAERPFGVLMLDLDGFKLLNDRFGHAAGDELLRDVAAAITEAVRDQDTVARMGGDEFCVLAPETDIDGTRQLADRVQASIAAVTVGLDRVGASIGAAVFPADGNTSGQLFDAADQRLLEIKRRRGAGRSRRAA